MQKLGKIHVPPDALSIGGRGYKRAFVVGHLLNWLSVSADRRKLYFVALLRNRVGWSDRLGRRLCF